MFWQGEVKLHRFVCLQGHQSGNTEACDQTWPKKFSPNLKLGKKKHVHCGLPVVFDGIGLQGGLAYSPRIWLIGC
eukprot:1152289-Pelagomonas_calceolata.AAC.1